MSVVARVPTPSPVPLRLPRRCAREGIDPTTSSKRGLRAPQELRFISRACKPPASLSAIPLTVDSDTLSCVQNVQEEGSVAGTRGSRRNVEINRKVAARGRRRKGTSLLFPRKRRAKSGSMSGRKVWAGGQVSLGKASGPSATRP